MEEPLPGRRTVLDPHCTHNFDGIHNLLLVKPFAIIAAHSPSENEQNLNLSMVTAVPSECARCRLTKFGRERDRFKLTNRKKAFSVRSSSHDVA
jgi:hypothetical protein